MSYRRSVYQSQILPIASALYLCTSVAFLFTPTIAFAIAERPVPECQRWEHQVPSQKSFATIKPTIRQFLGYAKITQCSKALDTFPEIDDWLKSQFFGSESNKRYVQTLYGNESDWSYWRFRDLYKCLPRETLASITQEIVRLNIIYYISGQCDHIRSVESERKLLRAAADEGQTYLLLPEWDVERAYNLAKHVSSDGTLIASINDKLEEYKAWQSHFERSS